jgi:hypothetical protein
MNFMPAARLQKTVRGTCAYYTIRWSVLRKADKYDIQKAVPAMAGLYELYYRGADRKLRLFHFGRAWLGGLRAVIREFTDPTLLKDRPDLQRMLTEYECYYRYSICESLPDLQDLIDFFAASEKIGGGISAASGRYEKVRIKEVTAGEDG